MTPPMDLLDHATELFPEPPGALERLHARHARRRRNRRLAAIGTVAAIWIVLALVATGAFDEGQEPVPIDEPTPSIEPTPTEAAYRLTDELPAGFPTDFPLPEDAQPVASHVEQPGDDTVIQVWFRTAIGNDAMRRWFVDALPDAGWELGERGDVVGIWDLHTGGGGRGAIVIGKDDLDIDERLIHDSGDFPGERWDLYVRIATLPRTHIPDDAVVHGWPGTRDNPEGLYSWNAQGDSWMHNPSGAGLGVEITFSEGGNPPSGWNPVVVGGYDGVYDASFNDADGVTQQEWIVGIEGTIVHILVEAPPGTTQAEMAEVTAIVDSIRVEPQGVHPGFRLVFALPDGWDSG